MNRKQVYDEIKSLSLQDEIKNKYGKHYTNCSTAELLNVLNGVHKGLKKSVNKVSGANFGSIGKLVEILAKKRILLKSEVDIIMNN